MFDRSTNNIRKKENYNNKRNELMRICRQQTVYICNDWKRLKPKMQN